MADVRDPFQTGRKNPATALAGLKSRDKMPPYHQKHRTIAISVTREQKELLRRAAQLRGVSMSQLLRPVVEEFLAELAEE